MNQKIKTEIGLVIIVIFALTAGMIVWVWGGKNKIESPDSYFYENQNQTNESENIRETELTISEPTEKWETYRNEKYGFKFRYPSNFSRFLIGDEEESLDCILLIDNDFRKNRDTTLSRIVNISVGVSDGCIKPSAHYSGEGSSVKYLNQEKTKIGDYLFIKKHYQDVPMCAPKCKAFNFFTWTVIDPKINLTFMYNVYFTVDPEGHEQDFEKILSTFKFTE